MSADLDMLELLLIRRLLRKKKRSKYIRDIFKNRVRQGELHLLMELQNDPEYHQKYLRMSSENFNFILENIRPHISHPRTHRYPISAKLRLAVALRYLATGASQTDLAFNFRISANSVGIILREVLNAIWVVFKDQFLPEPKTNDWHRISDEFFEKWNFPNCCGAIDGKLVQIKNFAHQGSEYYNYKKFFSTNLLACADAKYKFVVAIIGCHGSESDSGMLDRSSFGECLQNETIPVPAPRAPPGYNNELPFVFIGDQGFALKPNLLRPFPLDLNLTEEKKIFNYRLSRARRVVENAFGILAARWRIFHTPIEAREDLVKLIIQASIVLHNFLIDMNDSCVQITPDNEEGEDGSWRADTVADNGLIENSRRGGNHSSNRAREVRNSFMDYFNSGPGQVEWQYDRVRIGHYM